MVTCPKVMKLGAAARGTGNAGMILVTLVCRRCVGPRLKLVQQQGINHIFGSFGFPGLPHEKVMRSIELFATEVMPHFREVSVP